MEYISAKQEKLTVKLHLLEVLYIKTKPSNPRILQFVTDKGIYEVYGRLKEFEISIGLTFSRCHRKYLVNLKRIKAINRESRKITFDNASIEEIECSRRKIKEVTSSWMNV